MSKEQIGPLSERELELVALLSQGLSNRQIAAELYISPNTVKVHLRNIYNKLKVRSRTEATIVAVRMGWVAIDMPQSEGAAIEPKSILPEVAPDTSVPGEILLSTELARPPLARWQRIYLALSAVLVVFGLWLIWPRKTERSEPFTDRPVHASKSSLGQVSRWKALAQMPTPRGRLAVVAHQGHIYAIAGEAASGVSGAVEVYLADADSWIRGADKPTPVTNVGAVALDGKIYVPGGSVSGGQISGQLEVYDPDAGQPGVWTRAKPMPRAVFAYAIAAHEAKLYLFGGWDGSSYVPDSYRYDPQEDAWYPLDSMSTPRAFAGAGTIRDRIYVVGGYDGQTELATCEVYDPREDTWEMCPPLNAARGGAGVAVIADTLYVIGGGWESYLVENEYFSPAQGTWKTFPSPLLQEWRNLGVASNGTFLYAIGGWDGEFLAVNQAYRALYRLYMPSAIGGDSSGSAE